MQIFVKNLTGTTIIYEVQSTDTILSFQRQVREKEGIPVRSMRLLYGGKVLQYERIFSDYGIQKESTIDLRLKIGGGSYCAGCILPALVCLSGDVSLECCENLWFDDKKLLHNIENKLINLNNDAMEALIDCIQTCGKQWNVLEYDDADYFQNHAERRHSETITVFIGAICNMIKPYLEKHRQSKMSESTQNSTNNETPYDSTKAEKSTLMKPVDINWLTFLHATRCPICFCRFNNVQSATDASNR